MQVESLIGKLLRLKAPRVTVVDELPNGGGLGLEDRLHNQLSRASQEAYRLLEVKRPPSAMNLREMSTRVAE